MTRTVFSDRSPLWCVRWLMDTLTSSFWSQIIAPHSNCSGFSGEFTSNTASSCRFCSPLLCLYSSVSMFCSVSLFYCGEFVTLCIVISKAIALNCWSKWQSLNGSYSSASCSEREQSLEMCVRGGRNHDHSRHIWCSTGTFFLLLFDASSWYPLYASVSKIWKVDYPWTSSLLLEVGLGFRCWFKPVIKKKKLVYTSDLPF